MYFVYIIESKGTGRYYIGQTDNLDSRIKRHNNGRNLSTKAYIPWELKWWNEYKTRSEAMIVEKELKRLKRRKGIENYIRKNNFRGVAQPGPVTQGVTRIHEKHKNQSFLYFSGLAQMI